MDKRTNVRQITFEGGLVPSPALFDGERVLGTIEAGLWDIGLMGFLLRHKERLVVTNYRIFQFSRKLASGELKCLELSKVQAVHIGSKFYAFQALVGAAILCSAVYAADSFFMKLFGLAVGGLILFLARTKVFRVSAGDAVMLPLKRLKIEESKIFIDLVCGAIRNIGRVTELNVVAQSRTSAEIVGNAPLAAEFRQRASTAARQSPPADFFYDEPTPPTSYQEKRQSSNSSARDHSYAASRYGTPAWGTSPLKKNSTARPWFRAENICAAGLIAFFFLPWAQLFGFSVSGYNLGKLGSYANLVWSIPVLSIFVITLGAMGKNLKLIGLITGSLPFIGLAFGFSEIGSDIFHVLGIGVYSTLLAGAALILAAFGVVKFPEAAEV